MMKNKFQNAWNINLQDPLTGRRNKPRDKGLTMVLDKGLGLSGLTDLLEVYSGYIDFYKFSFGTSMLYPEEILIEKINKINKYDIDVYPGGTLFEVAITQNRLNEYLFRAQQLGFTAIEISNGTISLPDKIRREAIFKAKSMGFKILTEVGKKDKANPLSLKEMQEQIKKDMENGVDNIIIEGRESGKSISIYREDGSIDMKMLNGILQSTQGSQEVLIWEAPLKKQQVILIEKLGSNVNLGNIQTDEVLALESLRRGLRGDTFKLTLESDNIKNSVTGESRVGA